MTIAYYANINKYIPISLGKSVTKHEPAMDPVVRQARLKVETIVHQAVIASTICSRNTFHEKTPFIKTFELLSCTVPRYCPCTIQN